MLDSISGPYTIDYSDRLNLESSYVLQAPFKNRNLIDCMLVVNKIYSILLYGDP